MKNVVLFAVLIMVVGFFAGCGEETASAPRVLKMVDAASQVKPASAVKTNDSVEDFAKLAAGFQRQCKCVEAMELDREMAKRVLAASGGIDGGVNDITKDQMNELILWWMKNHSDAFFDALVPPASKGQPKK